ncbi:MAG: DUF1638 domain-containing protein [Clostridia bacterium]|nr:DUF1638 domain-containing protein [Clostridia bacterium]
MKEVIIACAMLEDEVNLAMRETGCTLPVIWLERGLHEFPEKLRAELLRQLEQTDADTVLLAYGLCGNALVDVGSAKARLVIPRFDDCVRMLLSGETCPRYMGDCHALYFTGSWFRSDRFIGKEYKKCEARMGEKRTRKVYRKMFENYREVRLIDTGAYCLDDYQAEAEETAELFGLGCSREQGTIRILKKLFAREWDDEFLILPPGEKFRTEQFLDLEKGER